MNYQEHIPRNTELSNYVSAIWKMDLTEDELQFRHIPKNQSMLLFDMDGETGDTVFVRVLPAFSSSMEDVKLTSQLIGISFRADGLYRLMKTSDFLHVPDALLVELKQLLNQVNAMSFEMLFHRLEDFLIKNMDLSEGAVGFNRALHLIESSNGCSSIQKVCLDAGISERTLQRQFKTRIGLTPKEYSRVTRVNTFLHALIDSDKNDWMDTVVAFKYYDQPHLINEFKSIIKLSPREFAKRRDSLYHKVKN